MIVTPVCLVDAERLQAVEDAMMVNVSSRGARVLTTQQWRPEASPEFLLLAGETRKVGRVVYCEALPDGRFCVGLQFLFESPVQSKKFRQRSKQVLIWFIKTLFHKASVRLALTQSK